MDLSKLDKIRDNQHMTAVIKGALQTKTLNEKKQWFVDNRDKLVEIQRAFKAMQDKLGYMPKAFCNDGIDHKLDVIKLCGSNHIGVQVYWHYRYIVFPLHEEDGTAISIDDQNEPMRYEDHCELYDKLRFAVEVFPERFDKVIGELLAKTEKDRQALDKKFKSIEH